MYSFPNFEPVHASPVARMVKNLPAMQKIQVRSLGWEDPLEKGMATQSSILFFFFTPVFFPGECYGQRSLAGYSPGVAKSWTQLRNKHYYCSTSDSNCCFLTCIQVSQGAGKVVWYFHHFENFPQFVVIHIVKGFRVVNEAGVDVSSGILLLFLWCSRCWQFNLWFLWLFKIQLANLEILCSYTVEP